MTDKEAFERLKADDQAAMAWVYRTYRDFFIRHFEKYYQMPVMDAQELAIESLIAVKASAVRNANRPLDAKMSTLWIQTGLNIYNNGLKKKAQLPIVGWDEYLSFTQYTEGVENPFDVDDFEEVLPKVADFVNQMKEPCRTILNLYYWEKLTDKQVAEYMTTISDKKEMNESAAKMRRIRCIETLRKQIFKLLK